MVATASGWLASSIDRTAGEPAIGVPGVTGMPSLGMTDRGAGFGGSDPLFSEESDPARGRLVRRVGRKLWVGAFGLLAVVGGVVVVVSHVLPPILTVVVFALCAGAGATLVAKWGVAELGRFFGHEDRLVRSLAHEIRHPLHRMFAVADLGLDGAISTEEALLEAVEHAESLNMLLDDLFEVAQVISGAKSLATEWVAVEPLVDDAVNQLGDSRLVVRVVGGPGRSRVNARLVRLAITNLLRNAASHGYLGRGGEAVVSIEPSAVRVRDHGVGIDPERLATIQFALGQSLRRSGAGVGLSLTAWVADIHGGRLKIENHTDGGVEASLAFAPADPP